MVVGGGRMVASRSGHTLDSAGTLASRSSGGGGRMVASRSGHTLDSAGTLASRSSGGGTVASD